MQTEAVQVVVIELEDGRRGVFVGLPLVTNEDDESDCQVENVWFTDMQQAPAGMNLEQLARLVNQQLAAQCPCKDITRH